MRKIIFSVIMLYLFLCAFSQNLTISGLVKVYPGVYNYAIYLNGSIEKDLEVTVVCSENGDLGGRQNPHKTTIIFKPKQSFLQQVFIEWGHVESKTEFIRAYATKDSSIDIILLKEGKKCGEKVSTYLISYVCRNRLFVQWLRNIIRILIFR